MKKKEKRMILILLVVLVIAIVAFIISKNANKGNKGTENKTEENTAVEDFVQVLEDGTKLNKSSKLQETKTIDGMEVSDFQLTSNGNVTILLGTITNKSNEVKGDYPVSIKILDEKGNEIITVGGYIGELQPGKSTQLNCSATFDYANAYDFEITKK